MTRFNYMPRIVACGVISPIVGKVCCLYGVRSFSADDMKEVLRQIRQTFGAEERIALFWDNCRIHLAIIVREYAATPEINIELVLNIPYRPDLNGIELLWREAKRRYRA